MAATRTVGVSVTYIRGEDARVHISFGSKEQTQAYKIFLEDSPFQKKLQLDPKIEGDNHSVSMRLPSRIGEIRASSRLGGFNFVFNDKSLKDGWVKNMKLWDMDRDGKVFVKWDLSPQDLNRELGIRVVEAPKRRPSPPPTSTTVRR